MKNETKYIIAIITGFGLIIASIPIIIFMVSLNQEQESIYVEFTPNEMKSYPNHTAWFLLEIRTKKEDLMKNLSLSIITNNSIKIEYQMWDNSPLRKIVEIFLYPNISHLNNFIQINVNASSKSIYQLDFAILQIINWTSNLSPLIESMRDVFVSYLDLNNPGLEINASTTWEGIGNAPQILVVEHYLFKSKFWEMELSRHVMIAPYDWVTIYLRPRSILSPNWSGTINSWSSGNHTIIEIEPPNEIFR